MRLLISSSSQPSFPLINFPRYSALLELQPFKPFCFSFQDCAFKKLKSDTALKVSFHGTVRVHGDDKCNRWYFKFNGNECSGPMTIKAVVYSHWSSGNPNLHHHRSFDAYCENIPQGAVRVELCVGQCSGHTLGDAYPRWESVSRIMIEEVSRLQS